jgi:diadenylate cyclase
LADADLAASLAQAAVTVAKSAKANAILVYADAAGSFEPFGKKTRGNVDLILLLRDPQDRPKAAELTDKILEVPRFDLTRMGQIKMGVLFAFSNRLLKPGDRFVFCSGPPGKPIDTLIVMGVGDEYELVHSADQPELTEHIRRVVFQRVLSLALELAAEGREGKPVGAIFVIGNWRELEKFCQQTIINPFKGYAEKERNILHDNMSETVKEFAAIDGAFVIKGNGVIVSAATMLRPSVAGAEVPPGLGARHLAAAAITASAKCLAITVSESTGDVRVWRRGQMITEIERAARTPRESHPPTIDHTVA